MKQVYLDCNATTPIDDAVQKCIIESLNLDWGNPSSNYSFGHRSKKAIENARGEVAAAIGAVADEIIFTSGGTEASNMAIRSAVKIANENSNGKKVHIITSNVEHVATSKPLQKLEQEGYASVTYLPVDEKGYLSEDGVMGAIAADTCFISVMLANNETGVIFPLGKISSELKKLNEKRRSAGLQRILLHTDAAQAIGKISVNVDVLGVDFLTIAGHKFYGPRIGALYVRNLGKDCGLPAEPVIQGGNQERGYRPGTENTPMIVGLGKAATLVQQNVDTYRVQMKKVRDYLEDKLSKECDAVINCQSSPRLPNTASISFRGLMYSGAKLLETCECTVASTTAACHSQTGEPSGVLIACGIQTELARSAVRFSVGRQTTERDIDIVVEDIKMALKQLSGKS